MKRIPRAGELYRHYKNGLYQILTVARHSQTREEFVVYQALQGDFSTYVEPLTLFMKEINRIKFPDAEQDDRFVMIDRSELLTKRQTKKMEESQARVEKERAGSERMQKGRPGSDRTGIEGAGAGRMGNERAGRTGIEGAGGTRAGNERAGRTGIEGAGRTGIERAGAGRTGIERAGAGRTGMENTGIEKTGKVGVEGAAAGRAGTETALTGEAVRVEKEETLPHLRKAASVRHPRKYAEQTPPETETELEYEQKRQRQMEEREHRREQFKKPAHRESAAYELRANPNLLRFLDTDTYEEKYQVLTEIQDDMTDRLIDDIAVVLDVVIPEGNLTERYAQLKNIILTRQRFELTRLR